MFCLGLALTTAVTATAPGNTTVSASDTNEVRVLGRNCNVSVGGQATMNSLSKVYGTAKRLALTGSPGHRRTLAL